MEKRLNRDHILLQALYYVTIAAVFGFGTYTMLSRGYTSSQVGLLIATANLLSMLLNFGVSNVLDRSGRINVFQMSLLISLVLLIWYLINNLSSEPSALLSAAYVADYALIASLNPLFDSMSSNFIKNGFNIDFGTARAFGSLSYAISCLIFGNLTEKYSYKGITMVCIFFQILLIVMLYVTSRHFGDTSQRTESTEVREKADYISFISQHRNYLVACIGYAGLMATFVLLMESFLLPIVTSVGGSTVDSGNIQAVKGFLEIPVMFGFIWLERKIGLKKIFVISAISFVVKNAVMAFTTSVMPIYLSQILQCTTFAMLVPAFISYVNSIMKKNEIARAFALQAIIFTATQMIMNSIGGRIIDVYGVKSLCFMAMAVSIVSGILLLSAAGKNEIE